MNILKLQDQLKGLPDNALIMHVQNPTGQVPTYLALAELQRRKEMRDKYQVAATKPEQTVADELVAEATQPPPGLAGLPQAQPMIQAMTPPPEMPVQQMAQGGLADLDVGNMFEEKNYANGGIVAFADGGDTESHLNLDKLPSLNVETGSNAGNSGNMSGFFNFMEHLMNTPSFAIGSKEDGMFDVNFHNPIYTAARVMPLMKNPDFWNQTDGPRTYDLSNMGNVSITKKAQGGEVKHFEEGGTSRLGDWWRSKMSQYDIDRQINDLIAEKNKYRFDYTGKYKPEERAAIESKNKDIDAKVAELKALRSGDMSRIPSTPPGPNVLGSQAAADKMFGTQYDPSQSLGYKGAPYKEPVKGSEPGVYDQEKIKNIGDYAKELQDYLGPDKNTALQRERLAKMEGRAARMEEQAPWLALAEAGFGMMSGTSPFALTNIGAGAQMGVKSYAASQDKLAALEEKRMAIAMNIDQAERREKLAVAEFGAKSKEAAQERNFKRQLQREHDNTLKQMNSDDNLKALQAAMIKNQPDITQTLKLNAFIEDRLPQEEELILEDLGSKAKIPGTKNHDEYNKRMEKARVKLSKQARTIPGIPEVTSGSVTTPRAKFLGFE